MNLTEDADAELRGPGWQRLLRAARRRLERDGANESTLSRASVSLADPTDAERRTVIGLTGSYRPGTVKRLSVRLADLDRALRARCGPEGGLIPVLACLHGPLRDRPAERARLAEHRDHLAETLTASPLSGQGWYDTWRDQLAADGTLTRHARTATPLAAQARAVLEALANTPGDCLVPLPVLAERTCGDTKALTPGSRLEHLVLRALALRAGLDAVPAGHTARRALWETAGAVTDDLASQVLVLGLRCHPDTVTGRWLTEAADAGLSFRLTLRQLTAHPVRPLPGEVYVCENPAVLRTAEAELGPACPPLICTEGIPSAACHHLATATREADCTLHWRADFDWTGLRITADAVHRHAARPWRMTTQAYTAALAEGDSVPLKGSPAPSPWEPALADALHAGGRAVMEERLLTRLLADLRLAERPIHSDPQPIPRTQNAVAAALPPAQRMEFYREMGEATPETIGHVLTNWWLLVQVAGDPRTARTAAAVKAGTAPGRPASTVMRELRERGQ
ncbi:TIGR02679 family protein [Streptomyces sp. NPDC018000]|uniref:TIGR02679 family protein n=1 Tax=Streptomyces sp. NPDC018000 TaxID=3365028 RepID=UPI0037956834